MTNTQYVQCAVDSCRYRSRRWSRLCHTHARRLRIYGHPEAQPVRYGELIRCGAKAKAVLTRNAAHEGVRLACQELDALLQDAVNRAHCGEKLAPEMERLVDVSRTGATGLDVLVMVCAAVLHEHMGISPAPDTRSSTFRIARAVIALHSTKPRGKELRATEQLRLGSLLLDRYGPIAASVLQAVRSETGKAQRRYAALSAPLA